MFRRTHYRVYAIFIVALLWSSVYASPRDVELLHVSYDPTREFYQQFNERFAQHWQQTHQQGVRVRMSHGGSGRQALAVMQGLNADLVSLALAYDIDAIAQNTNRIAADWQARLPHKASPYTSTIVFLVRDGNPKQIHDWPDLLRSDVEVITPNPKTSGGARWNYLAAWGYALSEALGGHAQALETARDSEAYQQAQASAREFVTALYRNVRVMDTGARAATNTFIERGLGDVLIAWENEALLALDQLGAQGYELVVPSLSVIAEPPVAVVDQNAQRKGNLAVAQAYLEYLYAPEGQALAAQHYFRPRYPEHAQSVDLARFSELQLFELEGLLGTWAELQQLHFSNGGVFDQLTRR